MPFQVFDYRKDITNMLVTPQIRSRFLKMEVGQFNQSHTHDLGHEIFLILQGQAEFDIEGHKEVVGPGQMCIALTDEAHTVRNVGDDEVIMYLSVTPHILPTHTSWTDEGEKQPPRFAKSSAYDQEQDLSVGADERADEHLQSVEDLVAQVEDAAETQREQVAAFKEALADGDKEAALKARDAMWDALYPMFERVYDMAGVWNTFTHRTVDEDF
ncbi:MAG: cupin domain-containing protein [Candidatus Latescibacteria bacterium]|jgi:quercetin dioxygenase-like cupin family protein|nr:cupin domain-containing protein [Candidatus Latescibacterota bacterium]